MMDLIMAVLPWVLFGLAGVLYFSKVGPKRAGDGKGDIGRLNFGLCMGLVAGGVVSFLGLVPMWVGLGMGALLGVVMGSVGG